MNQSLQEGAGLGLGLGLGGSVLHALAMAYVRAGCACANELLVGVVKCLSCDRFIATSAKSELAFLLSSICIR